MCDEQAYHPKWARQAPFQQVGGATRLRSGKDGWCRNVSRMPKAVKLREINEHFVPGYMTSRYDTSFTTLYQPGVERSNKRICVA